MTKPQSEISKYLGSQAFLDAANRAIKEAIAEDEALGLPRAYDPLPPKKTSSIAGSDERGKTTQND